MNPITWMVENADDNITARTCLIVFAFTWWIVPLAVVMLLVYLFGAI